MTYMFLTYYGNPLIYDKFLFLDFLLFSQHLTDTGPYTWNLGEVFSN